MLEIIFFTVALVFLTLGIIGSLMPILPGPLFTYLGFLISYFCIDIPFSSIEFIIYTILTCVISFSDYFLQLFGVQKFGGGKNSIYGTIIGAICGFFSYQLDLF